MNHRAKSTRLRHPLPVLPGVLVVLSLAFFPLSQGPALADLPAVALPLGISLGIALYSVRLRRADYDADQVRHIAMAGWTGAIVASVGIWVLSRRLRFAVSGTPLLDDALTVTSIGSGIGIVLGAHVVHEHRSEDDPDRERVLSETVWTNEPRPNPVLTAVTTQVAELEGVEPLELDPLYEHIDPDLFTELRAQEGSQWQLLFYADDYEIRVNSQGTLTIYDTDSPDDETGPSLSRSSSRP